MVARSYTSPEEYRYGFNGQEREKELSDSHTSAEYLMYDGRLGRRWDRDPKPLSGLSPYSCFINSPILINDPEGDIPPWIVGFVAGASADYAGQVAANMAKKVAEGGSIWDSDNFTDIDIADILISGVEGAVTVGASASSTFTKAVVKKGIKRAVKQVMKETTTKKIAKKAAKVVAFEVTKAMLNVHAKENDIEVEVVYDPVEVTTQVVTDVVTGEVVDLIPVTKLKIIPDAANPNQAVRELRDAGQVLTTEQRLIVEEEAIKEMIRVDEARKQLNQTPTKTVGDVVKEVVPKSKSDDNRNKFSLNKLFESDYRKRVSRTNKQSHNRAMNSRVKR